MNKEQFEPPSTDVKEKILKHYVRDFTVVTADDFPSRIMRYYADITTRGVRCRTNHYSNPVFVIHEAHQTVRNEMSSMVEEIEHEDK